MQRAERGQVKLKALQHATDSAKAPMRSQDTASDTSTRPKTAKLTDKPASSTQASSSGTGDAPIPKEKAAIRKRPAQSEDEAGTLPSNSCGRVRHHYLQQQMILNKQFNQLRDHNHFQLIHKKQISQLRRRNHHNQKVQLFRDLLASRRE